VKILLFVLTSIRRRIARDMRNPTRGSVRVLCNGGNLETSGRDHTYEVQRANAEAWALEDEIEALQERLGRTRAAKRVNQTLVNQLERDIAATRLRKELVLANLAIRQLVYEGRRLLATGPASPHFDGLAQSFEEMLDGYVGIWHCQICGKAGDASETVMCDGGGTETHILCHYCHENGEREEHRQQAQGNTCASCVYQLQEMAAEEKARRGARHIH
jgi:hypothetical protein